MVKFKNENHTLTIDVIRYEFPNRVSGCIYDDNWLILKTKLERSGISLEDVGPNLLSQEILDLINWFEGLLLGKSVEKTLPLLEQIIFFEIKGKYISKFKIDIGIWLAHFPEMNSTDNYIMSFEFSHKEMKEISKNLLELYKKFPCRAKVNLDNYPYIKNKF